MSLLSFLLILLLLFLAWPLLRTWLFLKQTRRHFDDAMRQTQGNASGPGGRTHDEEYTETGERKIFHDDEGEEVTFEDLPGAAPPPAEPPADDDTDYTAQQQVEDAEFEEIK